MPTLSHPPTHRAALRAVVRREVFTARHNRYLHAVALVLLAGGLGVAATAGRPAAVAYGLFTLLLYAVPLFGVLAGVSSAQDTAAERPLLHTQPVPPRWFVLGKAAVLSLLLVASIGLVVGVGWGRGVSLAAGAMLWGLGSALALVSVSAGLAVGYAAQSRARGLMGALLCWFAAFGLYDGAALLLAGTEAAQQWPALWMAVLLINPIDAVRLTGLFGLEGVPFSVAGAPSWMPAVIAGLPAWVVLLTLLWAGGLLAYAVRTSTQP
ncbi:hypothetical protein [Salisaeta longa]|uniref:hypothetical protein n=1 Tax=Salisaeta longa TaxID=503170 RepID=UPI0004130ED1|nr:hypothetical protein [Salisaeta longa]